MDSTAYDTAWVARVKSSEGSAAFPAAIDWLRTHQQGDGSWGGPIGFPHDRIISTLAAIVALAPNPEDRERIARGSRSISLWLDDLEDHPAETVAFELLAPTLLDECRALGIELPYEHFAFIDALRAQKLARIPAEHVYSPASPLAFSLEHRGADLDLSRLDAARGANGSFGNSPSATAYALLHRDDPAARSYLERLAGRSKDGGYCNVQPFDVFEHAWVLFNLLHGGLVSDAGRPLVGFLERNWTERGVGWNSAGITSDCDDTALTLKVLRAFGHQHDATALTHFAAKEHFVCYHGERTTCASANIHAFDALSSFEQTGDIAGLKSLAAVYLAKTMRDGGYWLDKWHASPYYAVGHALIAFGDDMSFATGPRKWVLSSQNENGSWGYAGGTAEETAYALQGLLSSTVPDGRARNAVERGRDYLWSGIDEDAYPPLWIGKGLYTPRLVVRSAVLSALASAERALA